MALQKWEFDPVHSSITFWVRHMLISKVHGQFTKWTGVLQFDDAAPAKSTAQVSIEADSIDTRDPKRDGHLRSPDFLDVEKYPLLTFKTSRVEAVSDRHLEIGGELTIRGVTRPVVLDAEFAGRMKDPWGVERAGFAAKAVLERKDFGLTWNQALEAGGVLVGDKVEVAIEVEAIRAANPQTA